MYDDISSFPRSNIKKEHIALTKIKQEHIQMGFSLRSAPMTLILLFASFYLVIRKSIGKRLGENMDIS